MSSIVNIVPSEIHLIHVDVLESYVKDAAVRGDKSEFGLNIGHTVMHNLKDERVKIGLRVNIKLKNTPEDSEATFIIDFHFQIENLNKFYSTEESGQIVFSGLFIATLLGLSFSTARGIVLERLSNTNFSGIILPVIDPKELLEKKSETN